MNRILLTGGAGFIGGHLARALSEAGWEVKGLDLLSPQVHDDPERSKAEFEGDLAVGDVCDRELVASLVHGCDAVVHLAAETGVGQSMYEPDRYERVNVGGTGVVAAAARDAGAALVNISSRAIYGEGAYRCPTCGDSFGRPYCPEAIPRPSAEQDPPLPVSVYGETKMAGERTVEHARAAGLEAVTLRPQNVVGPGQALGNPYTGVLSAFAARIRAGLTLQVYGDGRQTRDFVDVADVARVISWLLDERNRWPTEGILNLGSGRRTTLVELAETARACAAEPPAIEHVEVKRAGDIEHACADMTLAGSVGAPPPRIPLAEAVQRFLAWAESRPAAPASLWDDALDELRQRDLLS
jgi:dTDP-L-rhamnose 4-epimerase